jgi:subtilisin family serine protease
MRLALLFVLVGLLSATILPAQNAAPDSYWVQLKDKNGTPFSIGRPEAFLSQRSIGRRLRQHIPIDETDLPVSPVYLDSLKKRGLKIVHTSKWLNGATVKTADPVLIQKIATLPFVALVQLTKPANVLKSAHGKFSDEGEEAEYDPAKYGTAIAQLTQLNGQYLHQQGFRGKGIQIAILDAGFLNANTIAAFDSLRHSDRILGTRDFVDPKSDIYKQNYHGMSVLSCMGSNVPGSLIGTAPDASFYLIRSEDVATEYLIEEDNWVAAAEYADSLGVDVINSSLGYYEFDDRDMNHTYADMNGQETRVTRGANMAFQKGILVFCSAGNEGDKSWKHIIAPADGENVIGVGAVDKNGLRATFSSVGPAFGGAVKPNVAATGAGTALAISDGSIGNANGTSFSSPVLAGMGACLLQANPNATAVQAKLAIERSANQYDKSDSLLGFGIPDFEKADKYLKIISATYTNWKGSWAVSPNPFTESLFIRKLDAVGDKNHLVSLYNLQGICLWQSTFKPEEVIILKNLANLPQGFLILSIRSGDREERIKLVKLAR